MPAAGRASGRPGRGAGDRAKRRGRRRRGRASAGEDAVRAGTDLVERSRRPATARSRSTSPGSRRGCRRSGGPRERRSPTPQVRVGHRDAVEAGESGGLRCARERAGQDETERVAGQASAECARLLATRRRSAGRRSGRCGVRDVPTRSRRGGPARRRCSGSGVVGRQVRSTGGPRRARRSAGSAAKNSRGRQPKSGARSDARDLADPRVVAIDLVVVELATVGDHRLEPLDLVLQVGDVGGGLDVRVALDDREQRADGRAGRLGRRRLVVDRRGRGVGARASVTGSGRRARTPSARGPRRRGSAAGRGAA